MNRAQALREIELLENYEFDRGDAPARLLHHLQSEDLEVVHAALRAAVNYFGLPGIYEQVFDLAQRAEDEDVRAAANAALWPVIQDGSGYERSSAVLPEPEAAEDAEPVVPREVYEEVKAHLLERVDASMESMEVRRRCLEALGHLGFVPEIRSIVLRFYHEAPNPWVKVSSIYAMGLCRDEVFERLILEELHSRHEMVVVEAIHAAATLGLEAAWSRVQECLEAKDKDLRFEAIAAVGMLAPLEEVDAVLRQLRSNWKADSEMSDALEIAQQSLIQRRETSKEGDLWPIERIWEEIEEMTESYTDDDDEGFGSPGV